MKDADCVAFLQWALPQLNLLWSGFRKVRGQVCKRIDRRLRQLHLPDINAYRAHLQDEIAEWQVLDGLCRVTVSRFYRDKRVFALLEQELLPRLAQLAQARGEDSLRIWSAGCAAGEEAYTLSLMWGLSLHRRFPGLKLQILATDADAHQLQRAERACYRYSSVKNLPDPWRERAFYQSNTHYCLRRPFRELIEFRLHDVRSAIPDGPFDLVLCRNLVFTYFDAALQRRFLDNLLAAMQREGVLLVGVHEKLPEEVSGFIPCDPRWGVYAKATPNRERG